MKNLETNYFKVLVALPLLLMSLTLALNYWLDPYKIFFADQQAVYSANAHLHPNMRLHKAYQVNLQKPDTIILGTSKAIQGFSLDHPIFQGKSLYNLASPLATMKEQWMLLEHARASAELKEVFFSIDFLSFNAMIRSGVHAAGFVEERLKSPEQEKATYWHDYQSALASYDALNASLAVLFPVENPSYRVLNGRGGREHQEVLSKLDNKGHRAKTKSIEDFFINTVFFAAPHRKFAFSTDENDSFYWLEKFFRTLYSNDIKATFFIAPSHARYWELIHASGLWPKFEQWKKRLALMNESIAEEYTKPAIALWDFSAANAITMEAFPELSDKESRMQYYYESVHFSQITGNLLLNKISGLENPKNTPENFGVPLESNSIDNTLKHLEIQQNNFRAIFPEYVEELKAILPKS